MCICIRIRKLKNRERKDIPWPSIKCPRRLEVTSTTIHHLRRCFPTHFPLFWYLLFYTRVKSENEFIYVVSYSFLFWAIGPLFQALSGLAHQTENAQKQCWISYVCKGTSTITQKFYLKWACSKKKKQLLLASSFIVWIRNTIQTGGNSSSFQNSITGYMDAILFTQYQTNTTTHDTNTSISKWLLYYSSQNKWMATLNTRIGSELGRIKPTSWLSRGSSKSQIGILYPLEKSLQVWSWAFQSRKNNG